MTRNTPIALLSLCLAWCSVGTAAQTAGQVAAPPLPQWQVLEFEEKAYWATARSRVEILPVEEEPLQWELDVLNSVVNNSEDITVRFDAVTGRAIASTRTSRGKGQRLKSYEYTDDGIQRVRRNPPAKAGIPPEDWPVGSSTLVPYPAPPKQGAPLVVTSPYALVWLAQRLVSQGDGKPLEVLAHTDLNFYRVRLTTGNGVPIDVDYQLNGAQRIQGKRETTAVALQVSAEYTPDPQGDFSLFGLDGDIILLFDRDSGLPLQIRGTAPRIGATSINLRSATLRNAEP